MGCNCNKGRGSSSSRRRTLRPTVGPRSVQQTNNNNVTPQQLRALGFQGNQNQEVSSGQLNAERRRIEKIRRQAIRKKLGR